MVLEKTLKIPLDARRSNQSILKEISNECSLEGLMLKLKLQYFGCLMWRADSFEKTLMLGQIEGGRRRGWQRKRCLLLGRKTMTNLESILKSRDIISPTKVHSQSYGFPVVTYGCESWNIKKTEHWRTDAFKFWCWRRLLRVPWTSRNQDFQEKYQLPQMCKWHHTSGRKRRIKEPLNECEREEWKSCLKTQHSEN